MELLEVLLEGDPRLRQKALKIRTVDEGLRKLAADMHATMIEESGVGLAGPQIGVMRRIIVVHLPEDYQADGSPELSLTLVNPEIVKSHGKETGPEACLSIPGWVGDVPRPDRITVKAIDLSNREIRIKANGILARVLQHEVDHLDGILFIDRIVDRSTLRPIEDEEELIAD